MYHNLSYDNGSVHEQPPDVDAMLFDVSNRMARAQLARQISSSSSFRERASRVLKPNSVGNSPQNPQRRRTVTAQTTSRRRSEMYNQNNPTSRPGAEPQPGHPSWSMSNVRPVSWHPSSMGINRSSLRATSTRTSSYEPQTRNSMIGYQTVAMNGLPTPMTQPDLNSNCPVDPFFSLDGSCIPYQQPITQQSQPPITTPQGYDPAGLSLDTSYQSYVPSDSSYHLEFPTVPLSGDYPTCSPMTYATQTWAESLSAFPTYTAPPTPDFLPIQNPSDMWQGATTAVQPRLTKPRSKELVGMGLYDTPDRNSFSLDSATDSHVGSFIADPHHESLGKGLKLEETWQPPAEEEEDDEDAESSDEEEEKEHEVEEPSPVGAREQAWQVDVMGPKVQDAGQQSYGDLSNQSFFFDGDDTYFDGGAYAQGQALQSNLQGVALKDYMWV
ncbi:hypothetical protein MMC17_009674 [Xylographa soralifera]|nr:hypothetical protein [Xylographa soralifera]